MKGKSIKIQEKSVEILIIQKHPPGVPQKKPLTKISQYPQKDNCAGGSLH